MKIALVVMVIVAIAVLLGLLYVSFKMLRKAQAEEVQQGKATSKQYQLHPKLKQELEKSSNKRIKINLINLDLISVKLDSCCK